MRRVLFLLAMAVVSASAQPASLAGFSDSGVFHLFINEESVATITYQWKPDGSYDSKCALSMAGQTAQFSLKLTPDAEGRWIGAEIDNPAGKQSIQRDGKALKITADGKTTNGNMREDVLTFDNYSPALMSQALRKYDASKGGQQTFPVRVMGGGGASVILAFKQDEVRTVGARDLPLKRWVYNLANITINVLAGPDGTLYLADIPEQHAAYVREGYETLRKAPAEDPLVSAAKYEVKVQSGVKIPMRDGVKLATDIYLPAGVEKAPLILVRTPYKKEMSDLQARYYARRGYAFAIQDVRGRFASEGVWEPFVHEAKDGYDAIEWLARQPWSNGKVGMIGASYLGWVQWFAASQHPPHLTTMIPNVSPPDPFHNIPYDYGVLFLTGGLWWASVVESEATADLSGAALRASFDKPFGKLLSALPVIDIDKAYFGRENKYWRDWLSHPAQDKYWADTLFLNKLKDLTIPVFHQSGWFDGDGIGTKLNYLAMMEYGHGNQKLTIGPWGHSDQSARELGGRDFGPQALIDLQRDYLRWFDHWLKGMDNGIMKEPLVSVFAMGSNRWLQGPKYPLPETTFRKLFLTSGGHANTTKGDGKLSFTAPAATSPQDGYVYNPTDPTPEPGFYEASDEDKASKRPAQIRRDAEQHREQTLATRQDILVYSTEPFDAPLTIAGPVSAILYASTSARDTDWFVHIYEIDESGKQWPLIAEGSGKIRARFRKSMTAPELLKPGEVYQYTIDLWQTGVTIAKGHSLRIEVASASFPTFSRNLNTGGNNETESRSVPANQAIYHDAAHPSHILLPVIPEK